MITFVLQFFTTKNSKFLAKNTIFDFSCKFTLNSIFSFNMFESRGVKRQTSVVTVLLREQLYNLFTKKLYTKRLLT